MKFINVLKPFSRVMKSIEDLISVIVSCLCSYKDVDKIVLFGSRANGYYRERSDIDLAVFSDQWTSSNINLAKDKLNEEVKTPLKFDLVLFSALTKELLKKDILTEGKVINESKKN